MTLRVYAERSELLGLEPVRLTSDE